MKPSGLISRKHTDGAGIQSSGRIGGDTEIRYEKNGSGLLLRPSVYATIQRVYLRRTDLHR